MRQRSGITILEMVVVVSVMTMVLAVAFTTLHTVLRAESLGMTGLAAATNRARLARQFRSDVHAAQLASVETDGEGRPRLRLAMSGATSVDYTAEGDSVQRTVAAGDTLRSRETYPLAPGETEFTVDSESGLVGLVHAPVIEPPPVKSSTAPKPPQLRVDAVLARDHRYRSDADDTDRENPEP